MMDFLLNLKEYADNWECMLADLVIPKAIISRQNLGSSDQEVQLLVKMIYENRLKNINASMTVDQFVRFESSSYLVGDFSKIRLRDYGNEGCEFIADAIAVFGGYSCYNDIED